ncbi:UPF0193 protein EVG1 isoform X1 [Pygocentrus nattereri]|uniref:Uncharacterized protein n=1 Tax=Pygocentrus nattereri TaxID=42514 RepID=A0AAR2M050_PYGNA|nr:UPF0193 protein EVG1 isoform X1 [Pygocentrus nattereri]
MKRMGDNTNGSEGLRNHPRVKYSGETTQLIQMMMRDSGLTSFQQRQINSQLKKGGALPLVCNPTSSAPPCHPQPQFSVSNGPVLSARPQRRSAEECRAGENYTREKYRPSATRDLEKEKHRLQSILATGQEEPQPSLSHQQPTERGEGRETDRFQEVLDEIEERRQFLEEMNALGRGQHYQHIINSQISQKIRELELIDRRRSEELRTEMMKGERKRTSEEQL